MSTNWVWRFLPTFTVAVLQTKLHQKDYEKLQFADNWHKLIVCEKKISLTSVWKANK